MSNENKEPVDSETTVSASGVVPVVVQPRTDDNRLPLPPDADPASRRKAFAILMLSTVCLGLGQTILFAVLPPIARVIGLADFQVSLIFTVSALMWVIMSPIWGRRSDKVGRKPILLMGVGMFAVSLAIMALILELSMRHYFTATVACILLVSFRSLYGIFASAGPAAAQAYVADRTEPSERASSIAAIAAATGLGTTLGPGIGGATARFGLTVPLVIVVLVAALSFLVILFFLPERSKPVATDNQPKLKLTDPRIRLFLLYGVGAGMLMVLPAQLVTFYLMDVLNVADVMAAQYGGIVFMVSSMASLFSQLVIIQRFGLSPRLLLQVSPVLIFIGFTIIALSRDFGSIVFGQMITGFGTGMIFPSYNAAISLKVKPEEQGAAAGIANSAPALAFVFGPPVAFSLYGLTPQTPFVISAVFAVALAGFARLLLK